MYAPIISKGSVVSAVDGGNGRVVKGISVYGSVRGVGSLSIPIFLSSSRSLSIDGGRQISGSIYYRLVVFRIASNGGLSMLR